MSRSLVLVDSDLDALGALASDLRARGLVVTVADGLDGALERVHSSAPDALVVADALAAKLSDADLGGVPYFVLAQEGQVASGDRTLNRDADAIARRLLALPPKRASVAAERGDFRGDLRQVSVVDLFQLLGMNRRTGLLSFSTPSGVGEVRLIDGEIADAAYRRLEGEKAVVRLLGETEGTFAFGTTAPTSMRRIQAPMSSLVMEGLRQVDEVKRRRADVCNEHDALMASEEPGEDAADADLRVLSALATPRTLSELLDDVPLPDLDVLETTQKLMARGAVRRITRGAERATLADPEHAAVLGAIVARLGRPGFPGVRVVVAAPLPELTPVMHALRRLAEAGTPPETVPAAPVPHVLATLRVGESAELELVGLPLLEAYAPLWALTLAGAAVLIRLDSAPNKVLDHACDAAEVPIYDAAVGGSPDPADPTQMAQVIRMALESVSGRK